MTPAEQNILLVGRHGIGKSEIISRYYQAQGLHVVTLFLGQMADPGDLIGLPIQTGDATDFLPPAWFPRDERPIVLFLDELNRARPELLQTVMDLCLSRRLAGRALPKGSRVVAAVNDGDEYQLTPLDPALVSRFNVYRFEPTVTDWLRWARTMGLDERVTEFIEQEPAWLDGVPGDRSLDHGLEPQPDRRAWTRLAVIVAQQKAIGDDMAPVLSGIIGAAAASRWLGFLSGRQVISGLQVLQDFVAYEMIIRSYPLHKLSLINESIFLHLDMLTDAAPNAQYADNLRAYVRLLYESEDREALAHMTNLFTSASYPNAVVFITTQAPDVYARLLEFVSGNF